MDEPKKVVLKQRAVRFDMSHLSLAEQMMLEVLYGDNPTNRRTDDMWRAAVRRLGEECDRKMMESLGEG